MIHDTFLSAFLLTCASQHASETKTLTRDKGSVRDSLVPIWDSIASNQLWVD